MWKWFFTMWKRLPDVYTSQASFYAFLQDDASAPPPLTHADNAIIAWRKARISELNTINIAGALIAAVVSSAFSWYNIEAAPWTAKAGFYVAFVFAIFAVSSSTQQLITLHGSGPRTVSKMRVYLSERIMSRHARFALNMPVSMLDMTIVMLLVGFFIVVYDRAAKSGICNDDGKIAFVVSLAAAFVLVSHFVTSRFLLGLEKAVYRSEDDGKSQNNERSTPQHGP
ncbi:hypothetical protein K458DRAFT_427967 [Lentithecium fluviatile CBS 122367]|uniref:Uncharacterized protein n=1 Tax=Lentithecium fluviatile CBS 122367 TaxID=1168545 RepID=A0A6G1JCW6_9PLEO|nr:hypothetical protein K458DRAFT_427967 [Lentithecium fluviatile CBS 122367]